MLLVLRKAPRLSAPHVDGWRWEHVSDLNVPAWRKWINRYSAGNIPEVAADFLASATGWALHKQTGVDRDATRLRDEAPKVRPLAVGSVMSRLAHCHAIARIANVATDHMGHAPRSVFTKAGIERAIHTTHIGLQAILDCILLSLDLENAFNTISRRSFLAEMYKNFDLHPNIPLVEMIYSRDSTVYYFDPNDASLLHSTVHSRTGIRQGDPLGRFCSTWRSAPPSGILENGARIQRRSNPFLTMESI
jgi:hypothetical protein